MGYRGYRIYNSIGYTRVWDVHKRCFCGYRYYTTDLSTSMYLSYTRDTYKDARECKDTSDEMGYRGDT